MIDLTTFPGLPTGEADEPVFREPWEAHAFALVIQLHERGLFSWQEWADELARWCGLGLIFLAVPLLLLPFTLPLPESPRWLAGKGLTLDKLDDMAALCGLTFAELARERVLVMP